MNRGVKIILFFLLLSITGCNQKSQNELKITEVDYQSIIHDLTSDKMSGRLTGTEGNKRAEEYIAQHFQNIGLEKFKGISYFVPYEHQFTIPDELTLELIIEYKNGSKETLKYGMDYIEQKIPFNYEGSGTYTFDINDMKLADRIVILNSSEGLSKLPDKPVKMVFIKSKMFKKYLLRESAEYPIIQLSGEKYNILKEKQAEIKQITFKSHIDPKKISPSNIVGMVRGKWGNDHRDAIVISAHFDSVGHVGNIPFSGSVDNATGTSTLIKLAENIKKYSDQKDIQSDIIFAAFNGEESGLQGSKAFVAEIKNNGTYSHIFNINIDCIGVKDGGPYLIIDDGSSGALRSIVEDNFKDQNILVGTTSSGIESDHYSFIEKNIPAITIIQEEIFSFIHTVEDTTDKIDYNSLDQIVKVVFNFVTSNNHLEGLEQNQEVQPIELDESQLAEQQRVDQIITDAKQRMTLGQYQIIDDQQDQQKRRIVVKFDDQFKNISKAETIIKGLTIPTQVMEYFFDSVNVSTDLQIDNSVIEKSKINQIYQIDNISVKNISYMSLLYLDEKGNGVQISISRNPIIFDNDNENSVKVITQQSNFKDRQYNIHTTDKVLFLTTEVKLGDKSYYVTVIKGNPRTEKTEQGEVKSITLSWSPEDQDSAIKFVHDINLEDFIKNLGI